jgi:type I restriction enzyme S subunit
MEVAGAGAVKIINKSTFDNITIICPSLAEQTAIANILSAADKEIDFFKKKLASLKEQKKGLMQVLLTGKKRVKS